jgi:hypothetical protein
MWHVAFPNDSEECLAVERLFVLALAMTLCACGSEVDKCVDAEVKAWELEQRDTKEKWEAWKKRSAALPREGEKGRDMSLELGLVKAPDERSKERVEADARKLCLKLQSK